VHPRSGKFQDELAVLLAQFVWGELEVAQPGEEFGAEDLRAAIKGVTGQPDHLLLGEAQRAGVVELVAQFALVDVVSEPYRPGAVGKGEGGLHFRIEAPDHLEHEQLVEVGVEQAADDRVELPGMIVDPLGNVDLLHHRPFPSGDQPFSIA
jgi:hypothetical protein